MWFKNLTVFRLTEPFILTADELAVNLESLAFRHCGPHEEFNFGWTAPMGETALVHSANGFMMLCGRKEERVLPAAVVNELVHERIAELEQQRGRKLSRKERLALKDELIFDALPKAFTFSRKTYAYLDPQGGWLVVDTPSTKNAEDLLSYLRQCLGSLPALPLNTLQNPSAVMTQWLLTGQEPDDVTIEDECELHVPEEEGGIIRCKRHDLTLPEIKNHLDKGKVVSKLAMTWNDRLSFVIDEQLAIKRLRFLELIQNEAIETEVDSEAMRFDVDFAIMTLELANFLPRLLDLFGGENKA